MKALQAQDAANERQEAERLARKAALYASIAHGRQRAKRAVTAVIHVVKCC